MSDINTISQQLGSKIDIYIFDQILKRRYHAKDIILDAGCGHGRNMHWFIQQQIAIYGIDSAEDRITAVKKKFPELQESFQVASLAQIPFKNGYFDHIICSAVLHFAKSEDHFKSMFNELLRVLKPKGTLFIRMCSDIGIEKWIKSVGNGRYFLPDQTTRFLLTRDLLNELVQSHDLELLEPLKTTNVNDIRCMSTLMLTYKR